jgi:formiminotetrahydrofolate cyclodeaminase
MDFLRNIATDSPLPAGGAASAYASCLAIGLLYKVILFEMRREGLDPVMEQNIRTARKEVERLLGDVERIVKKDPEAYLKFKESRRDPEKRDIKQHFSHILDVSMTVVEKSNAALEWANQLNLLVPDQMRTHLYVACELLMGAINGSIQIAKSNIRTIKDPAKKRNYSNKLDQIRLDANNKYEQVLSRLN